MAPAIVPIVRHLHQGRITALNCSPSNEYAVSGGQDGVAVLLDMASVQIVHTVGHDGRPVTAAAFDPSGEREFLRSALMV